jgi:thiosulfate/3-mercaptopyruvate sulfurtransferase
LEYSHPEVLVTTQWVQEHHKDPNIRIAEVDYDPVANYNLGHIPGSTLFDWRKDLNDPITRDILSKKQAEDLLAKIGWTPEKTLVLYGDFNNWFAAYAFWDLRYYGVEKLVLMNGGRKKWIDEDNPITRDIPTYTATTVSLKEPDESIRAYLPQVKEHVKAAKPLVDVRGPKEFTGEITAPPEYPNEHAQRGGHIPGAQNIPWGQAVREDGTFKSPEELKALYEPKGITPDKEIVVYCRIGERSSHSWFVLTQLLGYPKVRNYDGSWTEWGNMVRNQIEKPIATLTPA